MARKSELCSSLCSCPLLSQMQENFIRKFKVFPNSTGSGESTSNFKEALKALELPKEDNKQSKDDDEDNLRQPEINDLWHSFDEIRDKDEDNEDEENEENFETLDYQIVDEESKTPVPVYETMSEVELNLKLAKYGHGPMGKRAAIRLLNQIFEATHPIFSETTPIPRKIIRLLEADKHENNGNLNLQRQKRTKAKIALLMELDKDVQWKKNEENIKIVPKNDEKLKTSEEKAKELKKTFLTWLRKPDNAKLYNDILTLNPVLLEKLYTSFRQDLEDTRGVSKEGLANILDEMGVTYGLRNFEEC
ncbi:hypothetical protein ACQ4LE_003512 [Meloidogyne hapla]